MNAPEFDTNVSFDFEEGAMNTPSLGTLVGGTAAIMLAGSAAAEIGKKTGNAIYNKTAGLFKDSNDGQ